MRLPSLSSYAASPKRSLLILACLVPTLFLLLSALGRPSSSSSSSSFSSSSSSSGFSSPQKANFDYSPYVFDANSDKHKEFCGSLKGLQVFKDALKKDEEEDKELEEEGEGGSKSSSSTSIPRTLAPSLSPSILLESLALRIASPNSVPLSPNHHEHPTLPFAYSPHHSVPHLIHQSWKSHDPPPLYEPMIQSWRETYPESRWVLWNDTDNRRLVEVGYPELLSVYEALGGEIFRADLIRNLYMHAFGGIYSDLDSQAYRPLHPLFNHLSPLSSTPDPIAFLGRMETFTYDSHAIPNAFMASSPGHPFWLEGPVARAVVAHKEGKLKTTDPEHLTGPVALKESEDWWNIWGGSGKKGKVVVLEPNVAYPYSWDWRSEMQECLCWARSIEFNTKMCRALLPESYVISFWKHSW